LLKDSDWPRWHVQVRSAGGVFTFARVVIGVIIGLWGVLSSGIPPRSWMD